MNQSQKAILLISFNKIGIGISGGDRIFLECLRYWSKKMSVACMISEELVEDARGYGIEGFHLLATARKNKSIFRESIIGLFLHYLVRTTIGLCAVFRARKELRKFGYVYAASDAFPDLMPSLLVKVLCPSICLVAGYYLFIPSPFDSKSPYKGIHWVRGALYWFMQLFSYALANRFADKVCVTSQPDVKRFSGRRRTDKNVVVVRGGVDTVPSETYIREHGLTEVEERKYDACFIGRLHHQKGVLELLRIWRRIVDRKGEALLAVIGDGPLRGEMDALIEDLALRNNIEFFGFLDGEAKFRVFRESKVVLHPATYDSGGMAAAEAMAWGLPGVSFDLEALKSYYPKGMLKAPEGDIGAFAGLVWDLLTDRGLYKQTAADARQLILEEWDWSVRAEEIRRRIVK